jgi:hypothetical protein
MQKQRRLLGVYLGSGFASLEEKLREHLAGKSPP